MRTLPNTNRPEDRPPWAARTSSVLLLVCVLVAATPTDTVGAEPSSIQQLIADLNSDLFTTREDATVALLALEREAVEPLIESARSPVREVMHRSIRILGEFAMQEDSEKLSQSAWNGLREVIAANQNSPSARRARSTLEKFYVVREQRAIDTLEQLGARIGYTSIMVDNSYVQIANGVTFTQDWNGRVEHLDQLRWMRHLEIVQLNGEKFTNEHVAALADVERLHEIRLFEASVTDACLPMIAGFPNIQNVRLRHVPITDKSLGLLQKMNELRNLELYGTGIRDEHRLALMQSLPTTTIDIRNGAFLGVTCDPGGLNCVIINVQPKSAAFAAGLKSGDVILEYNGHNVGDFDSLTRLIARHDVGDSVTIGARRNGELIERDAKLLGWPDIWRPLD